MKMKSERRSTKGRRTGCKQDSFSPNSDATITTISHVNDIYSNDYWPKYVNMLLKEKKGILLRAE